ncbi:MAG: helix-turn-helix domain-containing protein [Actinomycetia bacterium]|nr:helix-turn-helix domain-containing protein [Actinomycetes bacterium]
MNELNNDETTPARDALSEALLDAAAGHPTSADLTDDERELIAAIAEWATGLPEALAELDSEPEPTRPVPVRADDPIAQMLGLIEDPAVLIDGPQVAAIRKSAGLTVTDLAARLNQRGWDVTTNTVFSWERNKLNPSPATINAVAEVLNVGADSILTTSTARVQTLDVLFGDESIAAFLGEWSRESNVPVERLAEHSKRLLATAGKRNATSATPQTLLAILQHFKSLPGFEDPV